MRRIMVDVVERKVEGDSVSYVPAKKEEWVWNVKDVPLEQLDSDVYLRIKRSHNNEPDEKISYYNSVLTFDIETTTIVPQEYTDGDKEHSPYGFMYQWQACLNGKVVFGRHWHEWKYLLYRIKKEYNLNYYRRMVVWCHNLPFEFQFMNQFVPVKEVFATDKRKIVSFFSDGIEFRCSYKLTNKSLGKLCADTPSCIHRKVTHEGFPAVEDFDYSKIRTSQTFLSVDEESYCYNDVAGLYECLLEFLNEDTIASIPLTSTGFVRRDVRNHCQDWNYRKFFESMRLNVEQYLLLRDLFRGGNCHANSIFTNKIVDDVYSVDEQSSYIYAINDGYYPVGRMTRVDIHSKEELKGYLGKYCCMFRILFNTITLKKYTPVPYIDMAHCLKYKNCAWENGRLIGGDYVFMAVTEIDYKIIESMYDFDEVIIEQFYVSHRGEFPAQIREVMMSYYYNKCTLKGIVDKEYEYVKSKNKLNAFFGMCVSAIDHDIWDYILEKCEWDVTKGDIQEALDKYFSSRSNFLAYQWGCYITAWARWYLQQGLEEVGNDLIYCDTDSVKFINEKHLDFFGKQNVEKIRRDKAATVPGYVNYNGKDFYLGIWEEEKKAERFKTLGAKKYAAEYLDKKTGKNNLKLTVSGMNKEKGAREVGCLENFEIGTTYEDVGRTVSFYHDCKKHWIEVDGVRMMNGSNIGIVDTTYTLGVTNEYLEYYTAIHVSHVAHYD